MNTEKFPEYREKVFQYIQNEILPKYPEIELCSMHVLPSYIDKDVEYIFRIKSRFSLFRKQKSLNELDDEIYVLLSNYCEDINIHYYILHILTIFKEY